MVRILTFICFRASFPSNWKLRLEYCFEPYDNSCGNGVELRVFDNGGRELLQFSESVVRVI